MEPAWDLPHGADARHSPPFTMASTEQQQRRTVSLQIPEDAVPGDTLSFVVDGTELQLIVPDGASTGQVLEIQVGGGSDAAEEQELNEEVTRIPLYNNKELVLHHQVPSAEKDSQKSEGSDDADGTNAMAWPAGLELVKCLCSRETETYIHECETVLELGSGLGLVGLALAAVSDTKKTFSHKTIVLSDCASAMPLLQYNVERNQHLYTNVTIQTQELNWNKEDTTAMKYDLIIGSDLLYNVNMIPALVSTLKRHAKRRILIAVRWRKPNLERTFFQDSTSFINWKLVSIDSNSLSWKEYGSPSNETSNAFFLQTMVAVKGALKPLANISESDTSNMMKEEHEAWERLQIQVYEGTVKKTSTDTSRETKRARVG